MTDKTDAQILKEAKAYIERGWCKQALAKDVCGNHVHTHSLRAVAWCAEGAVIRACQDNSPGPGGTVGPSCHTLKCRLEDTLGGNCINAFNDSFWTTKRTVLGLFNKTIKLCRELEA